MIATAVASQAVPRDVSRFKALDSFAQALSTVQTSYVDPVDEKKLLYDAARGMLHNLDPHSTFLPPTRYQQLRQDTEGEYGSVGLVLYPGELDDARPRVPPYPGIDEVQEGSPAEVGVPGIVTPGRGTRRIRGRGLADPVGNLGDLQHGRNRRADTLELARG